MADQSGKRSSGEPFKPPPAVIWNNMVSAGEAWAMNRLGTPGTQERPSRSATSIKVRNDSGSDRVRGEVLKIGDSLLTDMTAEHPWFAGETPADNKHFGILLKDCLSEQIGDLQVAGVCLAKVNVIDADHTHAFIVDGEYVLESSMHGPLRLLWNDGTGEGYCLVSFANDGARLFRFTLNAEWSESAADADILNIDGSDTGIDDDVRDPLEIFSEMGSGDEGLCLCQDGLYYVIQAPCPG
jgi:hypothetical protein